MPDKDTDSSVIESCFFWLFVEKGTHIDIYITFVPVLFWSKRGIAKLQLAL